MKLALAMVLAACATSEADRYSIARAEISEAYVRLLCPRIELDGGVL